MAAYSQNPNSNHGSGYFKTLDRFSRDLGGFSGAMPGGSLMESQSLVLENERGELVKASPIGGKKAISTAKTLAALKSHSEAERRRRERINAHLATLRGLVPPCSEKMDKATLLAEVISQVKDLKKNAIESTEGLHIPMDDDEVNVEPYNDGPRDGTSFFRASLCCDYRPDLLSDLAQALDALHLKLVKSEVSTLAGRLKNSFVFTTCTEKNVDDAEIRQLVSSVHQALNSVLDKGSSSPEYAPRTTLSNKRRKISFFDSSSSSS